MIKVGSFVHYIPADLKKGRVVELCSVLKVHEDGKCDLRWRRISKPDVDVLRVPKSDGPKRGHWWERRRAR